MLCQGECARCCPGGSAVGSVGVYSRYVVSQRMHAVLCHDGCTILVSEWMRLMLCHGGCALCCVRVDARCVVSRWMRGVTSG